MIDKRLISIQLFLFTLCTLLPARAPESIVPQSISIDDIYGKGLFSPETLSGLRSMQNGEHYSVQNENCIDKYSYRTGERLECIFDASETKLFDAFGGYEFSADESKILLYTGREEIYRHSFRAYYYVADLETGAVLSLDSENRQQLATFSPDGTLVAYVQDNNLFVRNLASGETKQLTSDGQWMHIINGSPDWVYEEEFRFTKGFCWSPDSKKIAYYRFDESRVNIFRMTLYGSLYPDSYDFKYPKAGEENSLVNIRVYDLEKERHTTMKTGQDTDQYIPRIKWTTDPGILSIMRLNRLQNQLDILHASAENGEATLVYREVNPRYISEASDNTVTYLADGKHFILNSERDGFFRFYLYNFNTGGIRAINQGAYDVDALLAYDQKKKILYYTSCEENVIERHVYSIGIDGSGKKRLSTEAGTNTASFSRSFKYYILRHSSLNSPEFVTLHNNKGKQIRVLLDNRELRENMKKYGFSKTGFLRIPTASGQELNAWMIKPADFDPAKKYPLFVYVYGGPESQKVTDAWGSRTPWFQMLAQKGYVIACVDNRGTNGRGEEFRKSTYMRLGELECIDQVEAARWLGSRDYIDESRMGIYGWSYGGFMTSLCLTKGGGTFKMGIAGAPVTNWRYYDTVYTERFMRTPQENPEGYDQNSPIHFAGDLQGKLLLIHGTGDDNVHFQNSVDFAEALQSAGKQFDMQFYSNEPHSFRKAENTIHLYTGMTNFIIENL